MVRIRQPETSGEAAESPIRAALRAAEIHGHVVRKGLKVARAHGYGLDSLMDAERLLGLLNSKPSLLQDYKQRRLMEVAAIIQAPRALAHARVVQTPKLDVLAAIVGRRTRDRGLLVDLAEPAR